MAPEPENRGAVLALIAVMALTGLGAAFVMLRGGGEASSAGPGQAPSRAQAKASRAWPDSEAPEVRDTSMISQEPERSSIDLVARPEGAAGGGTEGRAAAQGDAPAARSAPAPKAPPGVVGGLTEDEKSRMSELAGRDMTDPRQAGEVAASDRLWSALLKAMGSHPRLMAYLLNKDVVVKAFMDRPAARKNCQSASAFTSYLSDTKRPNGVTHAMDVFSKVLHGAADMPTVMFSSKLASAVQECPSVKSIVKDPVAIGSIAQSNPTMLSMMMDPALMKGLAANPAAMASFESVQNTLGQ